MEGAVNTPVWPRSVPPEDHTHTRMLEDSFHPAAQAPTREISHGPPEGMVNAMAWWLVTLRPNDTWPVVGSAVDPRVATSASPRRAGGSGTGRWHRRPG